MNTTTTALPLRQYVARKVARNLLNVTVALAAFFIVQAGLLALDMPTVVAFSDDAPASTDDYKVETHVAPSKADRLAAADDCWTGAAPADVTIPGHVVVTDAKGRTFKGGEATVAAALDQTFNGADAGLTIHAYCR